MRSMFVAAIAALLAWPAFADSFDFASGQVVTHRGTNVTLEKGATNDLDHDNQMECTSDAGCSIVVQTLITFAPDELVLGPGDTICTYVDGLAAQPPCLPFAGYTFQPTFQGMPALSKGVHKVRTKIKVQQYQGPNVVISQYQIVYTLYNHQ
jgi:hypothetical protein